VVLDAYADVLRCRGNGCGALLPVGWDCACPVCGDEEAQPSPRSAMVYAAR
jgi:hypothetical protein